MYANCLEVHDLPPIYTHWSTHHLVPLLREFGFASPFEMFAKYLEEQCSLCPTRLVRFISIGAGNCFLEVRLASYLRARGYSQFVIECLDLNPAMLERGRLTALAAGVSDQLTYTEEDFNCWTPQAEYEAVFADQSLHHVLSLETLFDRIKLSLRPAGAFIISDMIGRNGHQRWPEALTLVHDFWRKLPPSYRFNHSLERYEELYENWDCSRVGFEGVRSQDILPCLLDRFHFRVFFSFGNIIDPFLDRCFGPNFNPNSAWDRAFIAELHRLDQACIEAGQIKPTHLLAVISKNGGSPATCYKHLTPQFCVRLPDSREESVPGPPLRRADSYEWDSRQSDLHNELQAVCRLLVRQSERASQLELEVQNRTEWTLEVQRELEQARARLLQLQGEFDERTEWALELNEKLMDLHKETGRYFRNPFLYLSRLSGKIYNRLRRTHYTFSKKLKPAI